MNNTLVPGFVVARAPVGRSTTVGVPPVSGQYVAVRAWTITTVWTPSMVARTGPSTGSRSRGAAHAVCPSGASADRYRSFLSNGPSPGADWSVGVMAAVNPVTGSVTGAGEWTPRGTTHAACVDHPGGGVSVYTCLLYTS